MFDPVERDQVHGHERGTVLPHHGEREPRAYLIRIERVRVAVDERPELRFELLESSVGPAQRADELQVLCVFGAPVFG
jgi:hypothetical protein